MNHRRLLTPRRVFGLSLAVVALLAVMPTRWTGWVGWLRGPVTAVLTPAAAPMRWFGQWLRPGDGASAAPEALRVLEQQREEALTKQRQAEERVRELERQLQELIRLGPGVRESIDRSVTASVLSSASDLSSGTLQVRAGTEQGVTVGSVVVLGGVQLVGRVVDVSGPVCAVLPITHAKTGFLDAVVDVEGGGLYGCQLRAVGDGTLRGDLVVEASGVTVGQRVRLRDATWPKAAQMLALGRVTAVEPKETQPLRKVVTVKPEMDLRRVSDVTVLMPRESAVGRGTRP